VWTCSGGRSWCEVVVWGRTQPADAGERMHARVWPSLSTLWPPGSSPGVWQRFEGLTVPCQRRLVLWMLVVVGQMWFSRLGLKRAKRAKSKE
jgi:hypothetical protein